MRTLRRINVGSAFRVGLVVTGLIIAVLGLPIIAMQGLLLRGFSEAAFRSEALSSYTMIMPVGLAGLCFAYLLLVVFGAIGGGIQFALGAFFYNLTANWIGGIQIELSDIDGMDDL